MSKRKLLFEWRRQVMSADGPKSPMTRFTLLALSVHMDREGASCFPSIETIAMETKLCEKTVRHHLHLAENAGWIYRWKQATGRSWKRYNYEARIPAVVCPVRDTAPSKRGPVNGSSGPVAPSSMVRYEPPTNSSTNSSSNSSVGGAERARKRSVPLGYIRRLEGKFKVNETRARRAALNYLNDGGDPDNVERLLEYAKEELG